MPSNDQLSTTPDPYADHHRICTHIEHRTWTIVTAINTSTFNCRDPALFSPNYRVEKSKVRHNNHLNHPDVQFAPLSVDAYLVEERAKNGRFRAESYVIGHLTGNPPGVAWSCALKIVFAWDGGARSWRIVKFKAIRGMGLSAMGGFDPFWLLRGSAAEEDEDEEEKQDGAARTAVDQLTVLG